MQTLKGRDAIMIRLGSLIDAIDDYTHCNDINKGRLDPVDREFNDGVIKFIDDLTKFYYSWEERY